MKGIIKHFSRHQREIEIILEATKQDLGQEYFDIDFYNRKNHTSFSLTDGVKDYVLRGWKNGKNPSPYFNTSFYMQKYPDIATAKVNPLAHYIQYGKDEQRQTADYKYLLKNHTTNLYIEKQHKEFLTASCELECIDYQNDNSVSEGIIYFGKDKEAFEFLKNQACHFNDEMVYLVTYASSSLLKEGVYSMNYILEQVGDIGSLVFKRDKSLVKCSQSDSIHFMFRDDYEFTDFLLQKCVMSSVVILNEVNDSVTNYFEEKPSVEHVINRFTYITTHYRLEANVLMQYYHQLEYYLPEDIRDEALHKLFRKQKSSLPRIIISLYAFSNGGGEVVPVRIANELKLEGIPVVVHSLNCDRSVNDIRGYLDPGIPVFYTDSPVLLNGYADQLGVTCINTHHCSNQVLACEITSEKILHVATAHGVFNDMADEELKYLFDKVFKDKIKYWTYVSDKNLIPFQKMGYYNKDRFFKIVNGIKDQDVTPLDLSVLGIPESAIVVCLASRARVDKGWYKAIDAVQKVRRETKRDVRLLLVGNGDVYDEIKEQHADYVYPVGFQDNVLQWFKASDICILPTFYKGESFPLTLVEALLCEKPVIATDIGDVREMLTLDGKMVGELLHLTKQEDVSAEELADKIRLLIENKSLALLYSQRASVKKQEYRIETIVKQYLELYSKRSGDYLNAFDNADKRMRLDYIAKYQKDYSPKVSIIVPNFNYEPFLRRRLDSIYNQSYQNIEVILLDDVSQDSSRDIMLEYYRKYPEITKTCFNTQNGGVFHQWKKGIEMASGSICWIAEADDWCNCDFLETLVPKFMDPDVRIAYGKYVYAEDEFCYDEMQYNDYLASLDHRSTRMAYIHDSTYEVNHYLSKKNILVNVSGLIFRKFNEIDILCSNDWQKKKICGDWELYLKILKDGKIAFDPDAVSYFRIMNKKQKSAGSSVYDKEIYFQEHEYIAELLKGIYHVENDTIKELYANVKAHCYSLDLPKQRKIELMDAFDLSKALTSKIEYNEKISFAEIVDNTIACFGNTADSI